MWTLQLVLLLLMSCSALAQGGKTNPNDSQISINSARGQDQTTNKRPKILGIFNLGGTAACANTTTTSSSSLNDRVLAEATQRAVNRLDINLDLEIVDSCGSEDKAMQLILAEAKWPFSRPDLHDDNCTDTAFLVASPNGKTMKHKMQSILPLLPIIPVDPDLQVDLDMAQAVVTLARRLRWKDFILLADHNDTVDLVGQVAADQDLCLVNVELVNSSRTLTIRSGSEARSRNVMVVAGHHSSRSLILSSLEPLQNKNWIVMTSSPGQSQEVVEAWQATNLTNAFIVEKSYLKVPGVEDKAKGQDVALFHLMRALVEAWPFCIESLKRDDELSQRLGLSSSQEIDFKIWHWNGSAKGFFGELREKGLELRHPISTALGERLCEDCVCLNPVLVYPMETWPRLNLDPPMVVILTLAATGLVFCLCLVFFLCFKSCSEVVDGSQGFSIVILFILMATFSSILVFAFEADKWICMARQHLPSIVCAMLFAAMLARSLMLLTADVDGLPGHLSGLVQTFLFVVMTALQVAMAAQSILLRSKPLTQVVVLGRQETLQCTDKGLPYLCRFVYVAILLVIQGLISPFIVKSSRNYREGLQFCVATFILLPLWLALALAFVFFNEVLGRQTEDYIVAAVLLVTPFIILVAIFAPKCYLISTPTFKAKEVRGRPELTVSLQKINEMETAATDSTTASTASPIDMEVGPHHRNLRILGTTTTSSNTDQAMFESTNTLSDYLSANDIYDSLKTDRQLANKPRNRHSSYLASSNPAFDSDYPTYKLDRNTVVDTSIKWERYSFPKNATTVDSSPSSSNARAPPPGRVQGRRGTRL